MFIRGTADFSSCIEYQTAVLQNDAVGTGFERPLPCGQCPSLRLEILSGVSHVSKY